MKSTSAKDAWRAMKSPLTSRCSLSRAAGVNQAGSRLETSLKERAAERGESNAGKVAMEYADYKQHAAA
jgi:hypothetical protein